MAEILQSDAGRMRNKALILLVPCFLSALLLSLPWLVPHTGTLSLFGFVPLLCADAYARKEGLKWFRFYPFLTFVVWNAATTFWVCNATVGGGIFAILANAFQMAVVWALFFLSTKYFKGCVPYLFLALMWTAWEKAYFNVDISWPWLVLGNAFAGSTHSVQWYEFTGVLGGSLWVWCCNLGVFALIKASSKFLPALGVFVVVIGPLLFSKYLYENRSERIDSTPIETVIAQPNFDPYEKFGSLTQAQQTSVLLDVFSEAFNSYKDSASLKKNPLLLIAPETFTGDVLVNDINSSPTIRRIRSFLSPYPNAKMLLGASAYELYNTHSSPSPLARETKSGWLVSRNSAILTDSHGQNEIYHKSRLVVGVEMTPYPRIFVPVDDFLSKILGVSGLMGRCLGQEEPSVMHLSDGTPIGCAVCYESVYGDYCRGYVLKGAEVMTVITNDAWWGDTPGYRQHLNYSKLRAIELRRDIARCGNTGISCFISQKGDILDKTSWWERSFIKREVNPNSEITFYVKYGDILGRVCTFAFVLLAALLVARVLISKIKGDR